MGTAEVFTILGGILAGFALVYVGICLGNKFVTKKEVKDLEDGMDKKLEELEQRITDRVLKAFDLLLEKLVEAKVIPRK